MGLKYKKETNFSDWYTEVVEKSGLAEYSAVSGCIVYKPLGYAIWEKIQHKVDKRFKKIGIKNTYFPLLIPERLLKKEAEHFKGFVPEVAWVTQAGDTILDERLAIRPTSEVIMYESYKNWIRSWRDLPLRINQWNNVVRWEFKHPTPFLRGREFLWNEGHNVYADSKELIKDRDRILKIYLDVLEKKMALPGIVGRKTDKEKFAGAVDTYSIEHLMPNMRGIQGPDYHDDGQNFAKAFDIKFLDKNEKKQFAYQSTYAISTRELGVLVAVHSDNKGLVLPPKIAPIQVVIIPIFDKTKKVLSACKKLLEELDDFRVEFDDREEYSPGWKFNEWEVKGVPVRIEFGPKDLIKKQVVLVRRDTGDKKAVSLSKIEDEVERMLGAIQKNLFSRAKKFLIENTHSVNSLKEFEKLAEKGGFIQTSWCGGQACEDALKDKFGTKATNMPFDAQKKIGKCIYCGKAGKHIVNWAKSY